MMGEQLYKSRKFVSKGTFTTGIEGPACDRDGNIYAVNIYQNGTVGRVTPEGRHEVFLTLPDGSVANGIRFNSKGEMLIADYKKHHIFRANSTTGSYEIFAHDDRMNQPNDIAITRDDVVFASDPDWGGLTGKLWRISQLGETTLLEEGMGTTNGIEVSPCGQYLYVNESRQRKIWRYRLTPDKVPFQKELFYEFEDFEMDGMRCDANGDLFVTRYGKGTILILSSDAVPIVEIYLTGKKCSNLCFGGVDGCTCYVTIADDGSMECFRTQYPGWEWVMMKQSISGRDKGKEDGQLCSWLSM